MPTYPSSATQSQQFLQARLSLFGKALFLMFAAFDLLGNLYLVATGHFTVAGVLASTSNQVSVVALVVMGLVWWGCSGSTLPGRVLDAIDIGGYLVLSAVLVALGSLFLIEPQRDMTITLCLFGLTMCRTAVVPSTALRTGILAGVAFAMASVAVVLRHMAAGPDAAVSPSIAGGAMVAWGLTFTLGATFFSKMIFTLRGDIESMERLGQYTLVGKVGEGGVGQVYRAKHARLKRPTAIKIVRPGTLDDATLARFEREAQLTAKLRHPNTVTVYDYGRTADGVFYYAMEYLSGLNLDELVKLEGEQPAARVIHVLRQVVAALEEAHGLGLVHRDIKPSNIILTYREGIGDTAKIVDFGLVKPLDAADATLTNVGSIVGTPAYMAPETVLAPDAVDARTDLYALGAVAYFLVTGRHVFEGGSVPEIVYQHVHAEPEPPSTLAERAVPADLEAIILHCLQKDPAERPESAAELLASLEACEAAGQWTASQARVFWDDVPPDDESGELSDAQLIRASLPPAIRPKRTS